MSGEEITVFLVLGLTLLLFIWGRWRYDLIALTALMTLVLAGVVPAGAAFSGFGHPAVITVAAVLVITLGLRNSGVVGMLSRQLEPFTGSHLSHLFALMFLVAFASAFMNNVGALALLMPVALESARKHGRQPALILMPMAFAAILGGMSTMIGTPPNIIVSTYREEALGTAFGLFDFSPVGSMVALMGVIFVGLAGWRFLPKDRRGSAGTAAFFKIEDYITEVVIKEGSKWVDQRIADFEKRSEGEVLVVGLIRSRKRIASPRKGERLRVDDILILEADPSELEAIFSSADLQMVGDYKPEESDLRSNDVGLIEAVVQPGSELIGRTPMSLRFRGEFPINLLAIARQGKTIRRRLRKVQFRASDVLLLQGQADSLPEACVAVGLLPLAGRNLRVGRSQKPILAVGAFVAALILAALGILPAAVALTAVVLLYALTNIVTVRRMYEAVDWSIIVLLAAMLPVGEALQSSGGSERIAGLMEWFAGSLPDFAMLALLLIITMTLSDIINNAATVVLMAPIGLSLAERLEMNPDAFLMAVAVGASCAFLTPIGHQCNTLVLGPGGYQFRDYWRLGLPLEILIVLLSVPLIMMVWS